MLSTLGRKKVIFGTMTKLKTVVNKSNRTRKTDKEKFKTVAVYLREEDIEEAYNIGDGNLSLGVRELIKRGQTDSTKKLARMETELTRLLEMFKNNYVTTSKTASPHQSEYLDVNNMIKTDRNDPMESFLMLLPIMERYLGNGPMSKKELQDRLMREKNIHPVLPEDFIAHFSKQNRYVVIDSENVVTWIG